mgnify:CR=1 FL=1
MRGDDGFGPAVVDELRGLPGCVLIDAGTTPENHSGPIVRAQPDLVVILDAAEMGETSGTLKLFQDARTASTVSAGTHSMSLDMLATYLQERTGAKTALLVAQPENVDFGAKMSHRVKEAVSAASLALRVAIEG